MEQILNSKQLKFAESYLTHFNATKAAIEAGYSEQSATSIGAENLRKPEIKKYIMDKQIKFVDECMITKNMIIAELSRYAFRGRENSYTDVKARESVTALIKIGQYLGMELPEKTELQKKQEAAEIRKIDEDQQIRNTYKLPFIK
jgi:phage terminase small subunit